MSAPLTFHKGETVSTQLIDNWGRTEINLHNTLMESWTLPLNIISVRLLSLDQKSIGCATIYIALSQPWKWVIIPISLLACIPVTCLLCCSFLFWLKYSCPLTGLAFVDHSSMRRTNLAQCHAGCGVWYVLLKLTTWEI